MTLALNSGQGLLYYSKKRSEWFVWLFRVLIVEFIQVHLKSGLNGLKIDFRGI